MHLSFRIDNFVKCFCQSRCGPELPPLIKTIARTKSGNASKIQSMFIKKRMKCFNVHLNAKLEQVDVKIRKYAFGFKYHVFDLIYCVQESGNAHLFSDCLCFKNLNMFCNVHLNAKLV